MLPFQHKKSCELLRKTILKYLTYIFTYKLIVHRTIEIITALEASRF